METKISTELLQKIINYLVSKPFGEVNTLLGEIQKDVGEKNKPLEPAEKVD